MAPAPDTSAHLGRQFLQLAAPYWHCERKWKVRLVFSLLVLLTIAQVLLAIWISYWHRELFDALEAHSRSELLRLVLTFLLIFLLTVVVTGVHLHVKRWLQLDWRMWLTTRLVDQWMARGRHYRLQFMSGEHDNPDGRIAEDIRIATESAVGLFHSLLFSLLIFGSFVDILLRVSGSATLPGTTVSVPGYMVLLAFLYAGAGSALGFYLGRPLIHTTNRLQSMEANLRFGLARAREHSESIALMHGEGLERRSAARLFIDICRGWNRQTLAYLGIVSFSTAYGTLLPVFPILVAAPEYIAGGMSLGVLMQAAQAFQRLTSALSWPVDNLGEIARCRASAERVVSLYNDMQRLEGQSGIHTAGKICVGRSEHSELLIRQLTLTTPGGGVLLQDFNLHVKRGEHLLLSGDQAVTSALFKAVAGLWQWGDGDILLPQGRDMMFLPQRPFLPQGSLRAALTYPQDAERYDTSALHRALECAGISWLAPRLEDRDDWAHALPLRAQQRLGLARLFLQQPGWVFIEEATDAFDAQTENDLMDELLHELPNTTLLTISQHHRLERFHSRRLELPAPPADMSVPPAAPVASPGPDSAAS